LIQACKVFLYCERAPTSAALGCINKAPNRSPYARQLQPVAHCRSRSAFLWLIQLHNQKLKGKNSVLIDCRFDVLSVLHGNHVSGAIAGQIHGLFFDKNRRALNEETGNHSRKTQQSDWRS